MAVRSAGAIARLMLFAFALLLAGLAQAQAPGQRPLPTPQPGIRLDADSLAERHRALAPNAARLSLPALAGRRIVDGDGAEETLDRVASQLFSANAAFEAQARRSAGAALVGRPQGSVEAFELPDSYLMLRSTRVVVADPAAFARSSPEFASFMAERPQTPASYRDLNAGQKAGIDRFLAREAARLPAGDPLAAAARDGRDALVRAISEGKGEFEIVDTFVVPKRPLPKIDGRLQLPRFDNGILRHDRLRGIDSGLLRAMAPEPSIVVPSSPPPRSERPFVGREARHSFEQPFLTGFTLGNSWQWERRWNYPSGFFRISLGAGYGIGLRVPLRVSGTISPGGITRRAGTDQSDPLRITLTGEALDGDGDYFRRTGLERGLVMNGSEFVLNAGFYFGLKFNVFWTDVVHIPRRDIGFDLDRNWRPPFGAGRGGGRIVVPAAVTRTELDLGVLRGRAETGFNVTGRGEIGLDYEFRIDDGVVSRQRVVLRDQRGVTIDETLPALSARSPGQTVDQRFGVRISNPSYRADLSVTPEARISIRVGVSGFSRSFATDWIALNRFRINLGSIELTRHAGTASQYRFDDGFKRFTKLASAGQQGVGTGPRPGSGQGAAVATPPPPAAAPLPKFAALRLRSTGQLVRAGVTERTNLAAVSTAIGGWERFEIVDLGQGRIALRSVQNGRYVRGGADQQQRLAAVSTRVQSWETFAIVRNRDGTIALRNAQNGRYVSVGAQSMLAASAQRVGPNENFDLLPLQ